MVRNFKENPVTTEELTHCHWYVVVDNLIGGFVISNVDKTTQDMNHYEGDFEIANFMSRPSAQHMADLHNRWWHSIVWASYDENIYWSFAQELEEPLTEDEWFDYDTEYEAPREANS